MATSIMSNAGSKRITLDDVAQLAGVSSQTVSRVVNNHRYVSEDTRRRVMDAIRKLDYRPNRAARNLVTRRSCMLGIITFGLHHFGPAQMVNNVERTAKERGYGVNFSTINTMAPDEIHAAIENLGGRAVDGLVLVTPTVGVSYEALVRICGDIPFVQIDTELGAQVPSVVIDQRHGSHLVAQHLINLGHSQICEISGPLDWFGAQARHESWQETLLAAGLEPGLSVAGDWTARGGYEAGRRLLDHRVRFTGLVVANDQMALGAIRALREQGWRVPEDVSVVGFDDIPEAAFFDPPLTTVRQNFAALGEQSVDYLVALIDNPETPIHQRVLYTRLIERQSARQLD
jgi:DNA-binding LacI/PurR family transcriptional regulator